MVNSVLLGDTHFGCDFNSSASGLRQCWRQMKNITETTFCLLRLTHENVDKPGRACLYLGTFWHVKLSKSEIIINWAVTISKTKREMLKEKWLSQNELSFYLGKCSPAWGQKDFLSSCLMSSYKCSKPWPVLRIGLTKHSWDELNILFIT